MTGFRVVDTATRVRSTFLELVEATIESDDGDTFTRTIVRHPGAVTVVPITDDGDVLLVRQYRAAAGRDILEAPAGKRDVHGEPPEETGRRELEEEVGHRAGRMVLLAEAFTSPGFCDEYAYIYAALDLTPLASTYAATAEEAAMTVERFPLAEVDDLIARRDLVDATTIVGVLLARQLVDAPRDADR
ncbi:MAG TPA: NUDIX hydrolase [Acidimicrobiia bacterium]|jgi:ADP-ribose pyrophosphatase